MNDQDPFENAIRSFCRARQAQTTPELDRKVLHSALLAQRQTQQQPPTSVGSGVRRFIMQNHKGKLVATAALTVLAVVACIAILDRSTSPAWAIEDTARALEQFNGVYIAGTFAPSLKALAEGLDEKIVDALASLLEDGPIAVEFWAQANEQRTRSGNIKVQIENGGFGVADENTTHVHDPTSSTIYIQQGCHIMISPWLSGDFMLRMQEAAEDWQVLYGTDAATGRDLALISCTLPGQSHSMRIEIDLETKLPVRLRMWHNLDCRGTPAYDMQRIVFFKQLPDELFEFAVPDGAEVIECGPE